MVIFWAGSVIAAVGFVLILIYRSARRRRESLVLAFTERIGLSLTDSVVDVVDRRIRDRFFGFVLGGLAALMGFALAVLADPELMPTGLAGFAASGILVAAMATGGAFSALRQFALPRGSDASRVARLDAPTLADYVHPAWVWAAGIWVVAAVTLTASLFVGNLRSDAEAGGLPLAGVVVLAALAIGGVACAALLSRRLLAIPQPASDELELQWDPSPHAISKALESAGETLFHPKEGASIRSISERWPKCQWESLTGYSSSPRVPLMGSTF